MARFLSKDLSNRIGNWILVQTLVTLDNLYLCILTYNYQVSWLYHKAASVPVEKYMISIGLSATLLLDIDIAPSLAKAVFREVKLFLY
jgi:hypothetical protein